MTNVWDENELKTKNIGWYFPSVDGGDHEGFNNPSMENFERGIGSLTREIIQNSIDAVDDSEKPVEVEFTVITLQTKDGFPLRDEYRERFEQCKSTMGNKTKDIVESGLTSINNTNITYLKISDYNTKGLSGAKNLNDSTTDWFSLTKGSGMCGKDKDAGGSYGLGKSAPFTCSDLRAVFYYTLDKEGTRAFQGKSLLATHKWKNSDGREYYTRATGYFGKLDEGKTPLVNDECHIIPSFLSTRDRVGTDVFVSGFSEVKDWEEEITRSILENYFIAIHKGQLICRINGGVEHITEINKENLEAVMDLFGKKHQDTANDKNIIRFYNAYCKGEIFSPDADSILQQSKLHILTYDKLEISGIESNIAFFRKTGMKIENNKKRYPYPSYVIFEALGEKINAVFQSCEPPAHNKWDYKRLKRSSDERKTAKKYIDEMNDWIRKCVISLAPPISDQCDPVGVGAYLPIETAANPLADDADLSIHSSPKTNNPFKFTLQNTPDPSSPEKGLEPRSLRRKGHQNISPSQNVLTAGEAASPAESGEKGAESHHHGTKHVHPDPNPLDPSEKMMRPDPDDRSSVPRRRPSNPRKSIQTVNIPIKSFRVISSDSSHGKYKIAVVSTENLHNGRICLMIAGDSGSEPAPVLSAKRKGEDTYLTVNTDGGTIVLGDISSEDRIILEIELAYRERTSLAISLEGSRDE